MPRRRLSSKFVEHTRPPAEGQVDYFDDILPGLFLRVFASGRKSWMLAYRNQQGRQRRFKLGIYPGMELDDARNAARDQIQAIQRGDDPAQARRLERTAPRRPKARPAVVGEAVELYLERYVRPRYKRPGAREWIFRKHVLPYWADLPLAEVQRRHALELVETIELESGPIMANRAIQASKACFNWLVDQELVTQNPLVRVKASRGEAARDRVLNNSEIRKLWGGAESYGWPFGPFWQLLLLTGQRRTEVAEMRWDEIDLEEEVWRLPSDRTKNGRAHTVPLSQASVRIIATLPRVSEEFVFSINGSKPISGFSRSKQLLDREIGIAPWTLHDLRRTAASGMARQGVDPHIIEKVLNHLSGQISGVAAIYNRHGYEEEKREALEGWAEQVEALVATAPVAGTQKDGLAAEEDRNADAR